MRIKNKLFISLSISMGLIVAVSNYLVQIPFNYFSLQNILTYGAFTYPITFLITDLANRSYGKNFARKIVYVGFTVGVAISLFISTNFSDVISIRVAIGSGLAFFIAQNIDVNVFDKLRKNLKWYIAPLTSSIIGSTLDTFIFFFVAFYSTSVPWLSLAFGDLVVKILVALTMLVPFRIFIKNFKDFSQIHMKKI